MSVVKVIEIHSEGSTIEGAADAALREAAKTVNGINNIYLQDFQAIVAGGKIVKYRVNAKVSFVIEG